MLSPMHVHGCETRRSDEEYFAEVGRRVWLDALDRRLRSEHWRLALWAAFWPAWGLSMWIRISEGPDRAIEAIAALCLSFAALVPIAWTGVAAFYWIAAMAENAWDNLSGED